jgi:hypothetical protein
MRYLGITILTFLFGCKQNTNKSESYTSIKTLYTKEFKLVYFEELLKKGFNSDKGYLQATSIDRSNFAEPMVSPDDLKLIDSITFQDNQKMVLDSIQSILTRAEGAVGKQVFTYALDRYQSRWLDSIANSRFIIFSKYHTDFLK